jgi:hypothetical protein
VVIDDVSIPPSLKSYQFLDLRGDFGQGIKRLVEQISSAPEIDFSRLDWKKFEDLVADLLIKLDFKNIERQARINNSKFDFVAEYTHEDPLEGKSKELWICELAALAPESHGLLVTNSQLTSIVSDWLKSVESKLHKDIRVIDGPKLKRLLLKHTDLIDKYFLNTAA